MSDWDRHSMRPEAGDTNRADFSSYVDYIRLLVRSAVALTTLERQARRLGLEAEVARLERTLFHLEEGAFSIAVVGEFKRGKSTVVNALLGSSALPMDVMPATASITRVVYGRVPQAALLLRDGRRAPIPIDELDRHITKIDDAAAARAAEVREAVISYPTLFCQNNVEIVDTPGLSDEEAMTRLTLDIIPKTDAALFVISALSPFSQTEASFLKQLLESVDPGRIFFVLTHIDRLNQAADVEPVTETVRRRVSETIANARLGFDGELQLRLFPTSAWQALEGKERRDNELYQSSRFRDLEQALEHYLTRDRGAAALSQVVEIISATIALQDQALGEALATVVAKEADQEERNAARREVLDAIVAALEVHLRGREARAAACREAIAEQIETGRETLKSKALGALRDLQLSSRHLEDGEACRNHVADALHRVVDPLARQLGRDVAGLIRHFGTQEDAALGKLHARLDRALADRGDGRDEAPVAVAQAYLAAGDTANALATKQSRKLSAFGKDFASRFSPSAGGFTRASHKAKESFHKVLGFFGTGQSHAEVARARSAALKQLKEDYLTQLPGHIDYLMQILAIEATAMTALESVATDLEPILAREAAHVKELVEWRKVELQVERVREHTANAHERTEILEMQKTTRALLGEAERSAETLALALRPGAAIGQAA